jgi:hypothetical protein
MGQYPVSGEQMSNVRAIGRHKKKRAAQCDSLTFEKQKHPSRKIDGVIKTGRGQDVQTYSALFYADG